MQIPMLRRGAVGATLAAFLFAGFLSLGSCSVVPRSGTPIRGPSPVLSVDYVFGPVTDDAEFDLEPLRTSRDPAAQLRRAWVLLQRHRPQEAVDASAAVLYGPEPASPQVEAYGRYIRAEAFAAMGQAGKGDYDRQRARQLALDPRLRELLDAGPMERPRNAVAEAATARGSALRIEPRADWRPAPVMPARLNPMGRAYRVTVHHSAMYFRDTSAATAAGQLRLIQRNHMQQPERLYGDIGYHFLIDPAGRIWQGRDLKWQGAHARHQNNEGNIGICVLGNFVRGPQGQRPTATELAALRSLIAALADHYRIAPNQIFSHSDFVVTECPGQYLELEVQRIAADLAAARPVAGGRDLPAQHP